MYGEMWQYDDYLLLAQQIAAPIANGTERYINRHLFRPRVVRYLSATGQGYHQVVPSTALSSWVTPPVMYWLDQLFYPVEKWDEQPTP
jgi:hypothetical protein